MCDSFLSFYTLFNKNIDMLRLILHKKDVIFLKMLKVIRRTRDVSCCNVIEAWQIGQRTVGLGCVSISLHTCCFVDNMRMTYLVSGSRPDFRFRRINSSSPELSSCPTWKEFQQSRFVDYSVQFWMPPAPSFELAPLQSDKFRKSPFKNIKSIQIFFSIRTIL